MINRLLILIFFLVFLFIPMIFDSQFEPSYKTNKLNSSSNHFVDAISKVKESVVGISVNKVDNETPTFEFKNGIFVPYDKSKNIQTLGSG